MRLILLFAITLGCTTENPPDTHGDPSRATDATLDEVARVEDEVEALRVQVAQLLEVNAAQDRKLLELRIDHENLLDDVVRQHPGEILCEPR